MRAYSDVALLTKAKTHIGGFAVRCTAGLSFFLEPGMELWFVPPRIDCPRHAKIASVEQVHDMVATVTFDGFASMQQMQDLVGAHCLIDCEEMDFELLVRAGMQYDGMLVVDEVFGELGRVSEIVSNPGQDLLVVGRSDAGGEPFMIPCVEAFIRQVDAVAQTIYVSVPAGLLEL